MSTVESIAKNSELRNRIIFSLMIVAVYRLGVHIPTPGVDGAAVSKFFQHQGGLFGLFNTFTGGALNNFSIFALGIMPYISSSIIFQLLTAVVPHLESLKKEGEQGMKKITQYTRYGTVVLAVVQGYAISSWLSGLQFEQVPLVPHPYVAFVPFEVMTILTLTAGTCFIMWLGEQISERGIGDGTSIVIFSGIVAGLPSATGNLFHLVSNGEMAGFLVLVLLLVMLVVIAATVFLEIGERRVAVHSTQRGGKALAGQSSYLPMKLNLTGVIPPIFASSLLMFPSTLAQFVDAPWVTAIKDSLTANGAIYNILFVALIVFFSFFYTEIVFPVDDMADNLKKRGQFIPGIRAGTSTAGYLQKVIDRLSVGGAIYLSAICVLPTVMSSQLKTPFYFGGTTLLIVVGVALNTTRQLSSHLMNQRYEGLLKGSKLRGRRVQY